MPDDFRTLCIKRPSVNFKSYKQVQTIVKKFSTTDQLTLREKCPFGLYFPTFGLNMAKYGPENVRIRTLFTQCFFVCNKWFQAINAILKKTFHWLPKELEKINQLLSFYETDKFKRLINGTLIKESPLVWRY